MTLAFQAGAGGVEHRSVPRTGERAGDVWLGTYFLGNGEDGVYLASSEDGLRFEPIVTPNVPILSPRVGTERLMRDACLQRGPDGVWRMVWTTGWWEKGFGLAHSKDLVEWSEQRYVEVMKDEPGAVNVWAPEIAFDPRAGGSGRCLVLWSSTVRGRFPETEAGGDDGPPDPGGAPTRLNHRIYCTATEDFESFTPARLWCDPGFNCIDATLLPPGPDGAAGGEGRDGPAPRGWLVFLKDETRHPPSKNIRWLRVPDPWAPGGVTGAASAPITGASWAEGPTAIRVGGVVRVFFDCYTEDRFGAVETADFRSWTDISDRVSFPPHARHGTVVRASRQEVERVRRALTDGAANEAEGSPATGSAPAGSLGAAVERAITAAAPATCDTSRGPAPGWPEGTPRRPVATYSIVARDAATGEMGVAVQSHWFSVGAVVPWAEAGVGAVATQSLVDVRYGPLGLSLMRGGRAAADALRALIETDDGAAVRQVAMVDAQGRIAVHTGDRCIAHAGHAVGTMPDGTVFSCQANLMRNDTVPAAMRAAFEGATGPLAERLVAALAAAEHAGGDVRGRQSAAILVVRARSTGRPWEDRLVDLRVEDHADPVEELARLLRLHRAYERMNAGDLAIEKGDVEGALREYSAARAMAPGNAEMSFWTAVSLVNAGRVDDAVPLLRACYRDTAGDWRATLRRLPKSGLLPDDAALIERLATLPAE